MRLWIFQLVRFKTLNCYHNGMRLVGGGDYILHVRIVGPRGHTVIGRNLKQPPWSISVATYFKTISSNFTEVVLVTLCSQLLLHIIKTGYDFCYPTDLLQSKFSKVDCHSFIMPQSGLPHPMISMKAWKSPWTPAFPLDMHTQLNFPSYIYISLRYN